jgi:hypothetical protein
MTSTYKLRAETCIKDNYYNMMEKLNTISWWTRWALSAEHYIIRDGCCRKQIRITQWTTLRRRSETGNVLALEVHQRGGEDQPLFTPKHQWNTHQEGWKKDLRSSLKGLKNSMCALSSWKGENVPWVYVGHAMLATHSKCNPWEVLSRVDHPYTMEGQLEVKNCLCGTWKQEKSFGTWVTIQEIVCREWGLPHTSNRCDIRI